jgi:hypothetical protein
MAPFWLIACSAGLASAVLYALPLWGASASILFAHFAQLPLLLVGLTMGFPAGIIAGLAGMAATAVLGELLVAGGFAVICVLPALLVVRQALLARPLVQNSGAPNNAADDDAAPDAGAQPRDMEWYPPGLILMWLVGLGILALTVAAVVLANRPEGFQGSVEAMLLALFGQLFGNLTDVERQSLVDSVSALFPGMVIASWLLVTVINAVLAQAIAARLGRNIRPTPDIAFLELPRWAALALGGPMVLALLGGGIGYYGQNAVPMLALPFLFAGLAVVHAISRPWPTRPLVIGTTYLLLVFGWMFMALPELLLIALGLLDQMLHLRRRFA